jgi:hypothetical protein
MKKEAIKTIGAIVAIIALLIAISFFVYAVKFLIK